MYQVTNVFWDSAAIECVQGQWLQCDIWCQKQLLKYKNLGSCTVAVTYTIASFICIPSYLYTIQDRAYRVHQHCIWTVQTAVVCQFARDSMSHVRSSFKHQMQACQHTLPCMFVSTACQARMHPRLSLLAAVELMGIKQHTSIHGAKGLLLGSYCKVAQFNAGVVL